MTNERRRLAWISVMETISFAGLLVAMLLESEGGVSVLGAIHGLLFLAYAYFLWIDHDELGWPRWFAVVCIVAGPAGAIVALERLRRERADAPRGVRRDDMA